MLFTLIVNKSSYILFGENKAEQLRMFSFSSDRGSSPTLLTPRVTTVLCPRLIVVEITDVVESIYFFVLFWLPPTSLAFSETA